MMIKNLVMVARNKQTRNYVGCDEYGYFFDIKPTTGLGSFMSYLFHAKPEDEKAVSLFLGSQSSDYKLIKVELTLTIKEIN